MPTPGHIQQIRSFLYHNHEIRLGYLHDHDVRCHVILGWPDGENIGSPICLRPRQVVRKASYGLLLQCNTNRPIIAELYVLSE
jgi:hypothetical protein